MRKTWFHHPPMTTEEAHNLITLYQSRNVPTTKTLSADPRLWVVAAFLPEHLNEPRVDRRYQNKIWS